MPLACFASISCSSLTPPSRAMTAGVLSRRCWRAASPSSIVRRTNRSVSATMSAIAAFPSGAVDRIDDRVVPRRIVAIVGIVELLAPAHAEAAHQAPAPRVAFDRERNDLLGAETVERESERR